MASQFGVIQWGGGQFGQPPPPAVAGAGCDIAASIADIWFRLGFQSGADMAVPDRWVTIAELYQFGDDAAKLLARVSSLFLTLDSSVSVLAATPLYEMPSGHVFTLTAWLTALSGAQQQLRLSSAGQLWALDGAWPLTSGAPLRLSLDAGGVGTGTLYPNPVANAVLNQVLEVCPATVAAGASTLPISPVLQDCFTYFLLAGARGKESDSSMPEMAAHFQQRCALYEAVIDHLWGTGV
jgi:hypothetical protein